MTVYLLVILLTSPLLSFQWPSLTALLHLLPLAMSSADLLPVPTLSTDPSYHFYYEGEHLAIICSAATQRKIGGFRFFNQSGEQIDLRAPYPLPFAWLQLKASTASAGTYTCMYFVEDSGQEIPSNRSLPLSIKVQTAPVAPTLSLDPQQQVYISGNSVKLLCSIPSSPDNVREVQYYADFGFAVSIPVSNVKNYSYDLKITGEDVSGSYSCAYFVMKSMRPVRSERSRWINVNVKSYKIGWIREIIVGGSFFTINGLIFFFSHCLMKRTGVQH
ncbi:uncharacterized protein LOC130159608 isoform X1 [Falco biarmicus]|uniref:uncharacterized protein LOC106112963 isoform X1 n=2 Tax=Falco peregrinus TaxID=8954 RepID=UPI000FFC17C5|nr:uncharacterized protein LOC106112963 isoform X1 [Falco peregrinus]XP_027672197.1 uncharacterized protein LOC106631667 isoform X1 [Falco cherrug]XP_037266290.1 uncharacterized protein LOC119158445 isoform X1 [Falco rusticolus]XP_056217335.1 uncharacterized protein LOC130159608 isoform X1 [Falco biarmicus]